MKMLPADLHPDFQAIPLFNLKDFDTDRSEFIYRLREVCHNIGFFYVEDHGVSLVFMEKMLRQTAAFFDLPQSDKEAMNLSLSPHFRGYGKLQAEMTEGKPDFKETLDFGLEQRARELQPERPFLRLQGPNQWPASPLLGPEWREMVLQYLVEMQKLGERLMRAMALTLGLPESFFADQFSSTSKDSFALLRLLKYPPSSDFASEHFGVGAHVDSGCLVILLQDDVGGLQVQNRKGDWVDAPSIPGTFVVNIGKMLQIWSNHYFLATPHRVLNSSSRVRYSVPFFFEPSLTTEVSPLSLPKEFLTDQEHGVTDAPVVYGEHMWQVATRSFPSQPF
jgi:isopenicillin N synthase-like dioxygenase